MLLALALLGTVVTSGVPLPERPSVTLHIQPSTAQPNGCSSFDVDTLSCSELSVEGTAGYQRIFVFASRVESIAGIQFGIAYPPTMTVASWQSCTGGLEIETENWPETGTGISVLWSESYYPAGPDGLALVGYLDVLPGALGPLAVVAHPTSGVVEYVDDSVITTPILPADLGVVDTGGSGTGFNPCAPPLSEEAQAFVRFVDGSFTLGDPNAAANLDCSGPPNLNNGVFPPRIDACQALPERSSGVTVAYGCIDSQGDLVEDLDMAIDVEVVEDSGFHFHAQNRPDPDPVAASGNTGGGLSFTVQHRFAEDARQLRIFVYSTDPSFPCGSQTSPLSVYCVREDVFQELTDGPLYNKVGGPDNQTRHPNHHFGTPSMIAGLQSVASEFVTRHASPPRLSYNDISLPWGGLFDVSSSQDWQPPHCGHRFGTTCDIRTWDQTGARRADLRSILTMNGYKIYRESSHWHSTLVSNSAPRVPQQSRLAPLRVEVTGDVIFDEGQGLYTYNYTVTNEHNSGDVVEVFAVSAVNASPVAITSPEHWTGAYGFANDPRAVVWDCTDIGNPPPGWVDEGNNLYPSEFAIQPAETRDGFSFTTTIPPDEITYFARAWGELDDVSDEFTQLPSFWDLTVSGTVVGPSQTVSVPEFTVTQPQLTPVPNPFSSIVRIPLDSDGASIRSARVFDSAGRLVVDVTPGHSRRNVELVWDGRDSQGRRATNGVYFIRVTQRGQAKTTRVTLLR